MNVETLRFVPEQAAPRAASALPQLLPGVAAGLDVIALLAGATIAAAGSAATHEAQALALVMLLLLAPLLMAQAGLYRLDRLLDPLARPDCVAAAVAAAICLAMASAAALGAENRLPADWLARLGIATVAAVAASRIAMVLTLRSLVRRGLIGSRIALVGTGAELAAMQRHGNPALPPLARLAGCFATNGPVRGGVAGQPLLGGLEELGAWCRAGRVDAVLLAPPAAPGLAEALDRVEDLPMEVWLATGAGRLTVSAHGTGAPVALRRRPVDGWGALAKRVVDCALAGLLLVLLAPVMATIALVIRIDSPGPVLFRQRRLGYNNRSFTILKFRTMRHGPAEAAVRQARAGDPRITRVGRLLRRSSLDELPQLVNVLQGSMSLVGPRPHALCQNADFGLRIRGYYRRHKVKPGITGWAQVNGLRGETRTLGRMRARIAHDLHYVENWSLRLDLAILWRTLAVVAGRRNAC